MDIDSVNILLEITQVYVNPTTPSIFIESARATIEVARPEFSVIIGTGPPGSPGTPGEPGAGISGSALTGEDIIIYRVVALVGGFMYHADPTNINHAGKVIGVASQSCSSGGLCTYQQVNELSGGSFSSGSLYWAGLTGALSTSPTPPGGVWKQRIGVAKSPGVLLINLGEPVLL